MTHYWALVVFLGALAVMAAAADADQRRRDRYAALDEAADLCRGAQPDRTPLLSTKPSVSPAKKTTEGNDQNTNQENRS